MRCGAKPTLSQGPGRDTGEDELSRSSLFKPVWLDSCSLQEQRAKLPHAKRLTP